MSPGKMAAQVGHAAVEAYRISDHNRVPVQPLDAGASGWHPSIVNEWYRAGHAKLVMLAEDTEQLLSIQRYIEDKGFKTHLVIDEGRTEVRPFTPMVLGVEIVDRDDPKAEFFSEFKTYKEVRQPPQPQRNGRWRHWLWH